MVCMIVVLQRDATVLTGAEICRPLKMYGDTWRENNLDEDVPNNGPRRGWDVLKEKHPQLKAANEKELLPCDELPLLVCDDLMGAHLRNAEKVAMQAGQLRSSWQDFLLWYRPHTEHLRHHGRTGQTPYQHHQ